MLTKPRLVLGIHVAIASLVTLLGCAEVGEDDCTASYLQVRVGNALLFIVDCKEELGSLSPEELKGLGRRLHSKNDPVPLASYLQRIRMQTGGEERTTFCLMIGSKIERLDKDGSWSCLLVRGKEASAILFGPRSSLRMLDKRALNRVAQELDRQVVAEGLALLRKLDSASLRSSIAVRLNHAAGRRICDDLFFRSFGISEALP